MALCFLIPLVPDGTPLNKTQLSLIPWGPNVFHRTIIELDIFTNFPMERWRVRTHPAHKICHPLRQGIQSWCQPQRPKHESTFFFFCLKCEEWGCFVLFQTTGPSRLDSVSLKSLHWLRGAYLTLWKLSNSFYLVEQCVSWKFLSILFMLGLRIFSILTKWSSLNKRAERSFHKAQSLVWVQVEELKIFALSWLSIGVAWQGQISVCTA